MWRVEYPELHGFGIPHTLKLTTYRVVKCGLCAKGGVWRKK